MKRIHLPCHDFTDSAVRNLMMMSFDRDVWIVRDLFHVEPTIPLCVFYTNTMYCCCLF